MPQQAWTGEALSALNSGDFQAALKASKDVVKHPKGPHRRAWFPLGGNGGQRSHFLAWNMIQQS